MPLKGAEVVVDSCVVELKIGRTTATCFIVSATGTVSTRAVEAGEETMASANTWTKVLVETVGCGAVKTRVGAIVGTWLRITAGHAVGTSSSSWGVEATVRVLVSLDRLSWSKSERTENVSVNITTQSTIPNTR